MHPLIQFLSVLCVASYLCQSSAYFHQRARQTWSRIIAQTRTPADSRRARFHNARVVLEMADYAERQGYAAAQLASIRRDAMQARVNALAPGARTW